MVMAQRLDLASLALQGMTSAIAGGGQELAYRNGDTVGLLTTSAAIVGGLALKMFGGRDLAQFSDPIFLSGASASSPLTSGGCWSTWQSIPMKRKTSTPPPLHIILQQ